MQVTKKQFKNYLVNRSFLHQKAKSIHQILRHYKCLQVDPISVVAKSHELALWNRVAGFTRANLQEELYKKRTLFEYWLQLFSIIPLEYFGYLNARMRIKGDWHDAFEKQYQKQIQLVLDHVSTHGVTSSRDLAHLPRTRHLLSWSNGGSSTAILEYLWDRGIIMIHSRHGNHKNYDLTERILPKQVFGADYETSREFLLRANFDYLGAIRKPFLTNRVGYVKTFALFDKLDELLRKDEVVKLQVADIKTNYYVTASQVEEVITLGKATLHEGLNILSPLDPLIIDRKLIADIFDFDYTWEAYVPAVKRKFGYYGMPILYRGNFVGQIDLKRDSKSKVLTVLNFYASVRDRGFKKILKDALEDLENFIALH